MLHPAVDTVVWSDCVAEEGLLDDFKDFIGATEVEELAAPVLAVEFGRPEGFRLVQDSAMRFAVGGTVTFCFAF